MGTFSKSRAVFETKANSSGIERAIARGRDLVRPYALNISNLHTDITLEALATGNVETDEEKIALLLFSLGAALDTHYPDLLARPCAGIRLAVAMGEELAQTGQLNDVEITVPDGSKITISRELFRHQLAQAMTEVGAKAPFNLSEEQARQLAELINNQSNELFAFTRAPPLDQ